MERFFNFLKKNAESVGVENKPFLVGNTEDFHGRRSKAVVDMCFRIKLHAPEESAEQLIKHVERLREVFKETSSKEFSSENNIVPAEGTVVVSNVPLEKAASYWLELQKHGYKFSKEKKKLTLTKD